MGRDRSHHRGGSALAARAQAALGIAGPIGAAAVMPSPGGQVQLLTDQRPDVVVGAIAVLFAIGITWLLVAWALVVFGAAAASRVPGSIGAGAQRVLTSISPTLVRRVALAAAGVSVAAGLAACGASAPANAIATAAPVMGASAVNSAATSGATPATDEFTFDLDWPIAGSTAPGMTTSPPHSAPIPAAPPRSMPSETAGISAPVHDTAVRSAIATQPEAALATPEIQLAHATEQRSPAPAQSPRNAVVQPGDSLWSIAVAHLPDGASTAQIDAEWRAWYAANRDVIGADPNLVIPGQLLVAPDSDSLRTSAPRETIQ